MSLGNVKLSAQSGRRLCSQLLSVNLGPPYTHHIRTLGLKANRAPIQSAGRADQSEASTERD